MARYQIWDKVSNVIVPTGQVFTPEQWVEQHPMAGIDTLDIVISGGTINGGFIAEYTSFIQLYADAGCDFTSCTSQQECLDAIEAFEDARNEAAANAVSNEERIAAALEAQVLLSLPDDE